MNVSGFLDALYPPGCLACRRRGPVLCASCGPRVSDCVRIERSGLAIVAVGAYAGAYRRAILAFKRGRRDAIVPFAQLLGDAIDGSGIPADTLIVPVPTTRGRALERGFDQGVALARELASRERRPVLLALRKRSHDPQRGRSRIERLRAVDRFAVVSPALVNRANVVLVDDVVTTGATLADCAAQLAANGARVLGAFVLAHA